MAKIFVTDPMGKMRNPNSCVFQLLSANALPKVSVDIKTPQQTMLGFGIAVTDASCHLLARLNPKARDALLHQVFGEEGLKLNIARLAAGACDYACSCYSYDDTPDDSELADFTIGHDRQYIIPMLHHINQICPDIFYFSSMWSAPGWMKTGCSMYGGWLRERYLEAFSRYYVRFIEEYQKEGIRIRALSPQNEPETDQCGQIPAGFLHPEFEQRIIRDYLMPMLQEKGYEVKAWILDHNYVMWNRAKWMLDDQGTKAAVSGVAFHYYDGTADMATRLHEAHPEIEIHWTEGGPFLGGAYETEWCHWGRVFTEALNNWCASITGWNLLLDENGNPNIGPYRCAGLATIHSETNDITYSGQYHALAHFSRFVKRGASRLPTAGPNSQYGQSDRKTALYHTAFRNPDGSGVLIFTNPYEHQDICVQTGNCFFRLALSENSVTTVFLEKDEFSECGEV